MIRRIGVAWGRWHVDAGRECAQARDQVGESKVQGLKGGGCLQQNIFGLLNKRRHTCGCAHDSGGSHQAAQVLDGMVGGAMLITTDDKFFMMCNGWQVSSTFPQPWCRLLPCISSTHGMLHEPLLHMH